MKKNKRGLGLKCVNSDPQEVGIKTGLATIYWGKRVETREGWGRALT